MNSSNQWISFADFKTKVDGMAASFSLIELISIVTILRIETEGTKSSLAERILSFLTDLLSLRQHIESNFKSDSESEEVPNKSVQRNKSDIQISK